MRNKVDADMKNKKPKKDDRPTIMLVDDDLSIRLLGREILEKNNFNLIEAENGMQAVELYKKIIPDIILMDVKMPVMNGYEACLEIRKSIQGQHAAIVMMTGLDDQDSIDKSYQVGATDFVTKPVNWTILVNRLRYIFRSYQVTQNLDIARSDLELAISSLARNQELLTRAQDLAKIGSWELNLNKNEIRFSQSLYSILGINKKEINITLDSKMKNVKEGSKKRVAELIDLVKETKRKVEIEYWVEYPDVEKIAVKYVKEIIEYKGGDSPGLIGTIQDITEIKQNELELFRLNSSLEERVKERTAELDDKNYQLRQALEKLRTAQEKLFSYKKMEAFSEILVGISHEIRNPLNFVINFSDMSGGSIKELKETLVVNKSIENAEIREDVSVLLDQVQNNLSLILFHTKKIESIINSMLKHVDVVPMKLEKASIVKIIDESIEGLESLDPFFKKIKIVKEYDENVPKIKVMTSELGRVITEFLKDASFFMNQKLNLLGEEKYHPKINIKVEDGKRYITVTIEDNGLGIPKNIIDKVFNPFFTTKATGQGVGLGLSLAWEIITVHHAGKLLLDSEEGKYCKFTFTISKNLKEEKDLNEARDVK